MNDTRPSTADCVRHAWQAQTVVPGFNIPYLPMMAPVVDALRDTDSFGLIMVARLEWIKFEAGGLEAIRDEYERVKDENHTRLHLDHLPVIDEDNFRVPYLEEIRTALELGYDSVMVDGSRLPLDENIAATRQVVNMAHASGIPVEAELGAVMGHEEGPMPPYEELFASGKGFTDPGEARRFVEETGTDWLSVAIGSVHGAISKTKKGEKKPAARLNIDHLDKIREHVDIPYVLHGGTGIRKTYIREAIRHGIAKLNIATAIRQPYEKALVRSVEAGRKAVYETMLTIINEELEIAGTASTVVNA